MGRGISAGHLDVMNTVPVYPRFYWDKLREPRNDVKKKNPIHLDEHRHFPYTLCHDVGNDKGGNGVPWEW
jgi:hypothetical protein